MSPRRAPCRSSPTSSRTRKSCSSAMAREKSRRRRSVRRPVAPCPLT
jgi:hypothetical protein